MPIRDHVEEALEHLDLYHYLYPENYDGERDRFMDALGTGDPYQPRYTYPELADPERVDALLQQVGEEASGPLQERMADWLQSRAAMIRAIGTPDITERSRKHYGGVDGDALDAARDRFEPDGADEEATVDAATVKEAYAHLFDVLGMDYDCELIDAQSIRHEPVRRRIVLPRGKEYGVMQAERLLIHESTHAVRTFNGLDTGDPALVYGTVGHELVEEGLPSLNEAAVGVFSDTLPRITSRVIAVAHAQDGFHNLFQRMRELGLDRELAFTRTYRVKRGLTDTGNPGGFIKDHIYFQGYRLLQEADEATVEKLYAGKIGMDDLALVDQAPSVTRDDHLAAYRDTVDAMFNGGTA